jgi:predicted dehydrogenase
MSTNLLNRRDFTRTMMAAAAAPLWSPLWARSDTRPQRKLGVALVGLGSLSTNQIAPALQKTTHCRLAGIVTGTPAKAEQWKARYGIPDDCVYDYGSIERMTSNADIDVVYVVTPNALHAEHTIAAARAGKHVLCEKPMEVTPDKCEQMIAACERAGRQLAIAYRLRFEPHHLECARLARDETFGKLQLVNAGFGFTIGDPRQWRLDHALAGGGPLMDVGIYALQAARMLTAEEPTLVTAVETKTDPVKFRSVEESMSFQLTFPSGVIASCLTSYNAQGMNFFSAFAHRGAFGLNAAFGYAGQSGWRSDGQELRFDPVDHFATELDDFAQCILDERPTRVPGEEGLQDVRIMMAIYQAARSGNAVKL